MSREIEAGVAAFIAAQDPARQDILRELRAVVLGAGKAISEGIKWNAMSFRTHEWFATSNMRAKGVRLILHLGAKARTEANVEIADPDGLLEWLGKDRAMVTFADVVEVKARAKALKALVKMWVAFV